MEKTGEFYFDIPPERPGISGEANLILQVGALAGRLANEERTYVEHQDGRPENVAEHTAMLTKTAVILALEYFPHLDAGRVGIFASMHDDIEAYTKDTPTFDMTAELLADKAAREKLGHEKFREQFAHMPNYVELLDAYEAQIEPEAQFVRIVDKFMPQIVHFNQGGITLRNFRTQEVQSAAIDRLAIKLRDEYPGWHELIDILYQLDVATRDELYGE